MNSLVDPDVICAPVVGHREQDRAALVIGGRVDESARAALCRLVEQPLGLQCVREDHLHLGGGLLGGHDRGQPFAGHQVHDRCGADAVTAPEMCRVIDPDAVLVVGDPGGERLAGRCAWPFRAEHRKPASGQNTSHRGRGNPHAAQVGAAVREFAVGTVDLAPLVEQRHDLCCLLGPQAVDRVAAGREVDQTIGGTAGAPPPSPGLGQLQAAADTPVVPAVLDTPGQSGPTVRP